MGAENVQHGLTQASGVFRQVEELVSATHAHGVPVMPQMLNSVFQSFLSLPLLGVLRGFGLLPRGVFHCLGALVSCPCLPDKQNACYAESYGF